jgi:hydroxymethylbilane synthase
MKKTLRLGSRGSPLALLQAEEVKKNLFSKSPQLAESVEIDIVPIRTSGDWKPEQRELSFRELGSNKELFTKEIDEALQGGYIDMAVHSMKDVATWLPKNIVFGAMLERIDPRDAFIGLKVSKLEDLPKGAVVGTSSLRRQAQILALRPDLSMISLRGNVETRLQKLVDGKADATLLALAGLARLGLQDRASSILSTDVMLPAAAQGVIGVAVRDNDAETKALLQKINVAASEYCVLAERAFLRKLDGSCHTPIGALAQIDAQGQLTLQGLAATADGKLIVRRQIVGASGQAERLGEELGGQVKGELPRNFFAA